jgi:hypothetical protein
LNTHHRNGHDKTRKPPIIAQHDRRPPTRPTQSNSAGGEDNPVNMAPILARFFAGAQRKRGV